jgi:hypothetical protein
MLPTYNVETIKAAVLNIRRLCVEEHKIQQQLSELDIVQQILDTDPWTAEDLDLVGDEQHSRMDRCCLELDRRSLLGTDGHEGYGDGFADCPFWHCVADAKATAKLCFLVHQGRMFTDTAPQALLANTRIDYLPQIHNADNQLELAFHIVTLLYATFSIPLPGPEATRLRALMSHETYPETITLPLFHCLDLTPHEGRLNPDAHGLKPNLRDDIFEMHGIGRTEAWNNTRFKWDAQPVMPWRTLLAELVGYTRHMQSLFIHTPAFCPLQEVRNECAEARKLLQQKLTDITRKKQDLTVHAPWREDPERMPAQHPVPSTDLTERAASNTTQHAHLRRLRTRIQSLLNDEE